MGSQMTGAYQMLALYKQTFILLSWLADVNDKYDSHTDRLTKASSLLVLKYRAMLEECRTVRDDDVTTQDILKQLEKKPNFVCNTHQLLLNKKNFVTIGGGQ